MNGGYDNNYQSMAYIPNMTDVNQMNYNTALYQQAFMNNNNMNNIMQSLHNRMTGMEFNMEDNMNILGRYMNAAGAQSLGTPVGFVNTQVSSNSNSIEKNHENTKLNKSSISTATATAEIQSDSNMNQFSAVDALLSLCSGAK